MHALSESIYDKTLIQPEAIAADRANADAWVSAYQTYENQLLRDGKDVDGEANYAEFYRKFGPAKLPEPFRAADYMNPKHSDVILLGSLIVLCLLPVSIWKNTLNRKYPVVRFAAHSACRMLQRGTFAALFAKTDRSFTLPRLRNRAMRVKSYVSCNSVRQEFQPGGEGATYPVAR